MTIATDQIPYPGLRAFTRDESYLFFGRDACITEMIDKLAESRFLAVLGSSGSGKSSLVRTGLLEYLDLGLHEAGSDWMVVDFHPAGDPMESLAAGLFAAQGMEVEDTEEFELLAHSLRRGPRAIIEWCEAGHLREGSNLLLLADQFEELFRFSSYAGREEAEAFARLLIESSHSTDFPIYVCLTMRTEFLSDCAMIPGLAERINDGLFLTPRMNRDECEEAIIGPAGVSGFEIEPKLSNQLLNDMATLAPWENKGDAGEELARRADQLPLMQHVLNQLWLESATAQGNDDGPLVLRRDQYQAIGGLTGALDTHGWQVLSRIDALPAGEQGETGRSRAEGKYYQATSRIFRALVAGPSISKAVRRPCRFDELARVAGDRATAETIVDAFRAAGCNFLRPYEGEPLADDTIVDISHESLIRQWSMLTRWFEEEREAALAWQQLTMQQRAHADGKADLLSGLALANIGEFWDREQPRATWAERHGGDFAAIESFFHESRRQAEWEAAEEERAQKRKTNRLRAWLGGTATLAIIAMAGAWYGLDQAAEARAAAETAQAAETRAVRAAEAQSAAAKRAQDAETVANEQRSAAEQSADEAARAAAAQKVAAQNAARAAAAEREAAQRAERNLAQAERAQAAAEEAKTRAQNAVREQRELIRDFSRAIGGSDAANEQSGDALREKVRETLDGQGNEGAWLHQPGSGLPGGMGMQAEPRVGGGMFLLTAQSGSATTGSTDVKKKAEAEDRACGKERAVAVHEDASWGTRPLPGSLLTQCLARLLAEHFERQVQANSAVADAPVPTVPGDTGLAIDNETPANAAAFANLASQVEVYSRIGAAWNSARDFAKSAEAYRKAFNLGLKLKRSAGWGYLVKRPELRDAYIEALHRWGGVAREAGFPDDPERAISDTRQILEFFADSDIVGSGDGELAIGLARLNLFAADFARNEATAPGDDAGLGDRLRYSALVEDANRRATEALSIDIQQTGDERGLGSSLLASEVFLETLTSQAQSWGEIGKFCEMAQNKASINERFQADRRVVRDLLTCAELITSHPFAVSTATGSQTDNDKAFTQAEADKAVKAAIDLTARALAVDPFDEEILLARMDYNLAKARREMAAMLENRTASKVDTGGTTGFGNWLTGSYAPKDWAELCKGNACERSLKEARQDFRKVLEQFPEKPIRRWDVDLFNPAGWSSTDERNSYIDLAQGRAVQALEALPRSEGPLGAIGSFTFLLVTGQSSEGYLDPQYLKRLEALSADIDRSLAAVARYPVTDELVDREFVNEACRLHVIRLIMLDLDREMGKPPQPSEVLKAGDEFRNFCQPYADKVPWAIYTRNAVRYGYSLLPELFSNSATEADKDRAIEFLTWSSRNGLPQATRLLIALGGDQLSPSDEKGLERLVRLQREFNFEFEGEKGQESWIFSYSPEPAWRVDTFLKAREVMGKPTGPDEAVQFLQSVDTLADRLGSPMASLATSVVDEAKFLLGNNAELSELYALANLMLETASGAPAGSNGLAFGGVPPTQLGFEEPGDSDRDPIYGIHDGTIYAVDDRLPTLVDWPMFNGWDPMALTEGKLVAGDPAVVVETGAGDWIPFMAIFADEASREKWKADPVGNVEKAAAQWKAMQPERIHYIADRELAWARARALNTSGVTEHPAALVDLAMNGFDYKMAEAERLRLTAEQMRFDPKRTPQNADNVTYVVDVDYDVNENPDIPEQRTYFYRGAKVSTLMYGDAFTAQWPLFNGWDPVELAAGRFVAGTRDTMAYSFGGFNETLFANTQNKARWDEDDGTLYLAARQTWLDKRAEYSSDLPADDEYFALLSETVKTLKSAGKMPSNTTLTDANRVVGETFVLDSAFVGDNNREAKLARSFDVHTRQTPTDADGFAFDGYSVSSLAQNDPELGDRSKAVLYRNAFVAPRPGEDFSTITTAWPFFNGWDPVALAKGEWKAGSPAFLWNPDDRTVSERALLFSDDANREAWRDKASELIVPALRTLFTGSEIEDEFSFEESLSLISESLRSTLRREMPGLTQNEQLALTTAILADIQQEDVDKLVDAMSVGLGPRNYERFPEMVAAVTPSLAVDPRRVPVDENGIAFGGDTIDAFNSYPEGELARPLTSFYRGAYFEASLGVRAQLTTNFWPAFNGWDPVALSQGRFVAGKPAYVYTSDLYAHPLLFATEAAREAYIADEEAIVEAARSKWIELRPEYADDVANMDADALTPNAERIVEEVLRDEDIEEAVMDEMADPAADDM